MLRAEVVSLLVCLLFGCGGHAEGEVIQSLTAPGLAPQRVNGTVERQARRLVHVQTERETLVVTPEHPFATRDSGWVAAGSLSPGDFVISAASGAVRVSRVHEETLRRPVTVFNLSVERTHAYLVGTNRVLVHNKTCKDTDTDTDTQERLTEIVDLRIQIANNRQAETEAHAARQQLQAANKDTTEIDRQIAELVRERVALKDRLAQPRVRELGSDALKDTGWLHGTRTDLDRARLEEIRQELARGTLSNEELAELERELARSEPVDQEYLAAIWRELERVDTPAKNLTRLKEELSAGLREFRAREKELRHQHLHAEGARRDELKEQRTQLREDWHRDIQRRLERAQQQLRHVQSKPHPSKADEAVLTEIVAFLEEESNDPPFGPVDNPVTVARQQELERQHEAERERERERERKRDRDRERARLYRERKRQRPQALEAPPGDQPGQGAVPAPVRAGSDLARLRDELRAERERFEAEHRLLTDEYVALMNQRHDGASSSLRDDRAQRIAELQGQIRRLQVTWRHRMRQRLRAARLQQQAPVIVPDLQQQIDLLAYELANPPF